MADVTLSYKGSDILELSDSGSATLKTGGKYCEADIGVEYVKPSGGGGSGYEWKTYTGTMSFSDEYVTVPVIPVDSSNAVVLLVAFTIKQTGTVADGVVTYDDVPLNHGQNMCLGYGINYSTIAPSGSFVYRYGTAAPAAGESTGTFPIFIRYRASSTGVRLSEITTTTDISNFINSNGISLQLMNATRAFCRTGLYMEFEYTVKMLEEVTS